MPTQLTIMVPDGLMRWLVTAADESFRTPEGQVLWLISVSRQRPQVRASAVNSLTQELRDLHVQAGTPSTRTIAWRITEAGGKLSHATVHEALSGRRLVSWPALASIVSVLDGNVDHFRQLWADSHG
jgi:hypothetical protein